jgi:hypothetical protein
MKTIRQQRKLRKRFGEILYESDFPKDVVVDVQKLVVFGENGEKSELTHVTVRKASEKSKSSEQRGFPHHIKPE